MMEYYYEGGNDDSGLQRLDIWFIRYSVQDAKTHKRAFTLRTKIASPNR